MKYKKGAILFIMAAFFLSVTTGCLNSSASKWSYEFVVWNGHIYKESDKYVDEITKEIGEVTKYSDGEGTYSGNFSNKYEKGTKYFAIKGVSTDEAIAVKEQDGKYRKLINDGKYAGGK
ncbi:hypothetical protein [Metabacillus sp. RGM 3146]|uniref:hypothetical protein n=1 Tax=Metabacillus sp. RGM 3146 TaxID=3401092 RepID=UPI003B9D7DBA